MNPAKSSHFFPWRRPACHIFILNSASLGITGQDPISSFLSTLRLCRNYPDSQLLLRISLKHPLGHFHVFKPLFFFFQLLFDFFIFFFLPILRDLCCLIDHFLHVFRGRYPLIEFEPASVIDVQLLKFLHFLFMFLAKFFKGLFKRCIFGYVTGAWPEFCAWFLRSLFGFFVFISFFRWFS